MERKEAIEVIKKNWPDSSFTMLREALETLVPELKESEDERIRKDIIDYLSTADDKNLIPYESWIAYLEKQGENNKWKPSKDEMDALYGLAYITNKMDDKKDEAVTKLYQDLKKEFFSGVSYENMFPLSPVDAPIKLEKQVEKKPADKVEPKFKKGDWVVYDGWTTQIKEVYEDGYSNIHQGFIPKKREEEMRLWTIQDAKDGDVLANWNNTAFIFKAIEDETVKFHIAYNDEKWDEVKTPSTKLSHLGLPEPQFEFHPATKEQRDQLEKAMADAGYTFDFEKKELKEIEQKSSWSKEDEARFKSCIKVLQTSDRYDTINAKWLKSLKERVQSQPKQEWSEKDSPYYDDICEFLINLLHSKTANVNKNAVQKDLDWLKSLKDRVQPQQKWSEEDERMLQGIIDDVKQHKLLNEYQLGWLSELRPQEQWKPSDEHYELEEFAKIVRSNLTGISKAVQELFEAKYLQLTGNKMYQGFKD